MRAAMNRWIALLTFFVFAGFVPMAGSQEVSPPSKGQKNFDEGVALMEQGDFDAAILPLEKAIEIDPQFAAAFYALAVCQARKKNPDTASSRQRHKQAISFGFQQNEWLDNYCNELDKKAAKL